MASRDRECRDKASYGTWTSAQYSAKVVNRLNRSNGDDGWVHVYRCPACGGIHVGHARDQQRGNKRI